MTEQQVKEKLDEYIENISNRYEEALYCFELHKNLHRTLSIDIFGKDEAEKNCTIRNQFGWVL